MPLLAVVDVEDLEIVAFFYDSIVVGHMRPNA
jgi:hypothetical protein